MCLVETQEFEPLPSASQDTHKEQSCDYDPGTIILGASIPNEDLTSAPDIYLCLSFVII